MKHSTQTLTRMLISVLFCTPVHALYQGAPKCQTATQVTTAAGENIDWDELEPIADLATGRTLAPAQKRRRLETPQEQREVKQKKAAQDAEFKKFERVPEPLRAKIHEYAINPWPYWEAWLKMTSARLRYFSNEMAVLSPTIIGVFPLNDNLSRKKNVCTILDITNPQKPKTLTTLNNFNAYADYHALSATRFAYTKITTDNKHVITVVDHSDPAQFVEIATLLNPNYTRFHPLSESQLILWSQNSQDVALFDFSDPKNPRVSQLFSLPAGGTIHDIKKLSPTMFGVILEHTGNNFLQEQLYSLELWNVEKNFAPKKLLTEFAKLPFTNQLVPLSKDSFITYGIYRNSKTPDKYFELWDVSTIKKDSKDIVKLSPRGAKHEGISYIALHPSLLACSKKSEIFLYDIAPISSEQPVAIPSEIWLSSLFALDQMSFAYITDGEVIINKPDQEALTAFYKLSVNDRQRLYNFIKNLRTIQKKRDKSGVEGRIRLKELGLKTFKRMPKPIQIMLKRNCDLDVQIDT